MSRRIPSIARRIRGLVALAAMLGAALAVIAPVGGPVPVSAAGDPCIGAADDTTFTGSGTAGDPYLIENAADLAGLARVTDPAILSAHFLQTADIDLSACANWLPIGPSQDFRFRGVYDGDDWAITHLTSVSTQDSSGQGLFGQVENATITDVVLDTISISSTSKVGALISFAEKSTVSAVTAVDVTVESSTQDVGGLIGYANNSLALSDCHVSGTARGAFSVGGLLGYVYLNTEGLKLQIERCSAAVDVTATASQPGARIYAGGLVGVLYPGEATLTDVAAYGSVTAQGHEIGGIFGSVGSAAAPKTVTVTRAIATGRVATTQVTTSQGGLIGHAHGWGDTFQNLVNSYWDASTTSQSAAVGWANNASISDGTAAKASATMKSFAHFDSAGWNITNGSTGSTTWGIVDGQSYPFLLRCGSDLQRCGREALPAPTSNQLPPPPPPPAGTGTGDTSQSSTTTTVDGAQGENTDGGATTEGDGTGTTAPGETASTLAPPVSGVLPATGRDGSGWLAAGVVLIGLGAVLVRRRRSIV